VITADLPVVGQLRPRDHVRFEYVTIGEALELLREQEEQLCSWI
jgi:allophanate hydrolase subunit 2